MNARDVRRVDARSGYDLWAATYDTTDNPVVAMDQRHALRTLAPRAGERVLDAGCGTGRHLRALLAAGCQVMGADFSGGMLAVARERAPGALLTRADLQGSLPFRDRVFDAVLCALVGEHLTDLPALFRELARVLADGGRMAFTVYHPRMAAAGIEANFERDGVEYRLGAETHTAEDYVRSIRASGFEAPSSEVFSGDEELVATAPSAARHVGRPLLLVLRARRAATQTQVPGDPAR
jgi:SAM-dependent methyltransferase